MVVLHVEDWAYQKTSVISSGLVHVRKKRPYRLKMKAAVLISTAGQGWSVGVNKHRTFIQETSVRVQSSEVTSCASCNVSCSGTWALYAKCASIWHLTLATVGTTPTPSFLPPQDFQGPPFCHLSSSVFVETSSEFPWTCCFALPLLVLCCVCLSIMLPLIRLHLHPLHSLPAVSYIWVHLVGSSLTITVQSANCTRAMDTGGHLKPSVHINWEWTLQ